MVLRGELEGRFDANTYNIERLEVVKQLKQSKWQVKPLKFLTKFPKTIINGETELPYIGLENIESNTGFYIQTSEKESFGSAVLFQKGQILFPKLRPYLNKVYFAAFEGVCSTEFHVLESKIIDNKYLSHFLRSNIVVSQTKHLMSGNTLPRLQTEDIGNLLIPIPPLEIQQQIVQKMETAYTSKQAKEAEAARLLASIDSYLLAALGITLPEATAKQKTFFVDLDKVSGGRFDPFYYRTELMYFDLAVEKSKYPIGKIGEFCYEVRGVTYSGSDEVLDGKMILRANNIDLKTNSLDLSNIRHVRADIIFSERQRLKKNDIFMCAASGSKEHAGKVAFIDNDLDYYFGGFMMVLRTFSSDILPNYLFEIIASQIFRNHLIRILGGTNINNLNFSMFKNYEIPIPPVEIQTQIVSHISQIRKEAQQLEAEAKAAIEKAKKEVEMMILGEGGSMQA